MGYCAFYLTKPFEKLNILLYTICKMLSRDIITFMILFVCACVHACIQSSE